MCIYRLSKIYQKDDLIVQFGVSLHQRLGWRKHNDISQRLRQLGHLMEQLNANRSYSVNLTEFEWTDVWWYCRSDTLFVWELWWCSKATCC